MNGDVQMPLGAQMAGVTPSSFGETSRLRFIRHPIRVAAMAVAALSVTYGLVRPAGIVMVVAGAALGVILGELLGRTRVRLWLLLSGLSLALAAGLGLAWLTTGTEALPELLGPSGALTLGVVLRLGALSLLPIAALRAVAVRRPSLVILELAAVVAALAILFSAHRDGIIIRPLWLSDWAWRAGYDPKNVLLLIGGVAVIVLVVVMVAETGRRLTALSILALPILGALALSLFDVANLPGAAPDNELGLTHATAPRGPPKLMHKGQPDPHGHGGTRDPMEKGEEGKRKGQKKGQGQYPTEPGQKGKCKPGQRKDGQRKQGQRKDGQRKDGQQQQPNPRPQFNLDQPPSEKSKQSPMAVILLGDDYAPPGQQYYFRMETWSHYNGSRLIPSTRPDVDRDVPAEFPAGDHEVDEAPAESGRTLVHADAVLVVEHKKPFFLESPVRFKSIPNPNPERFARAYRFESLAQKIGYLELMGHKAGKRSWADDVRKHYLVGPADPRYAALASRIAAELPEAKRHDPFIKALAVKLHFDRNFIYSTRHRHAGVADPTADFLFGDRTGYCVHFAHAAAYLWRSLGIPARVSVGYAVKADDRQGSTLVIKGGDAHAWPELYLAGVGWIILDIAPRRNLDPPGMPPDRDMMRKLGDLARNQPEDPMDDGAAGVKSKEGGPGPWFWLLVMVISTLLALYGIKIWRRLAPSVSSARSLPWVGYRLALDRLAEVGLCREFGESRASFARRVRDQVPAIDELTRMNVAARFGDPHVSLDQRPEYSRQRWRDGLRQLKRELPGTARWWRRALGLFNPLSFFDAR